MNLLEQIKQKAQQAKLAIQRFVKPQGGMKFPTTSKDLTKSTEIAQRESEAGYYQGQGFEGLKNKLGLNYQDAQINSWQRGLKTNNPQLAAQMGNNPGFTDTDFTGSMAVKKPAQQVAKKVGEELKPVAKSVFQGFKDISTKLLQDLKGKSTVDKKFIEQRLVSSDLNLKQVEKDLIRSKLQNYPDKIDVNDFAESVKTDLLPLTVNANYNNSKPNRYESISLPAELRGNVQNYSEHIYESPIKTSAGSIHFDDYRTPNYFGHTRIEDVADSSLDKALRNPGGTRRVIEVQSDLYQKGNLENEVKNRINKTGLVEPESYIKMMKENSYDAKQIKDWENKIPEYKKTVEGIKNEVSKLQQYNDPTAHFRMVREEVKQAAIDGKNKLQFPTGETAMKIEGLGDTTQWSFRDDMLYNHKLTSDKLKVGQEIQQSAGNELLQRNNLDNRGSWIITDVLGDGKFKAVPKSVAESFDAKNIELIKDKTTNGTDIWIVKNKQTGVPASFYNKTEAEKYLKEQSSGIPEEYIEQFDISSKVDTNNPIYKFYEKDLGKYLMSKYDAKIVTDKQGVKWFELNVKPEWKDLPVEAFGFSSIQQMIKAGGLIGGGLIAQDILRNKKTDKSEETKVTREQAIESLKQKRDSLKPENENLQNQVNNLQQPNQQNKPNQQSQPTQLVKINNRIKEDGRWVDLIKNNGAENVSPRLLSALLMTENRGQLSPDAINKNKGEKTSYDVGLFQHNSPVLVNSKTPVEERNYQGTQADMNKLFKQKYGRNYDVYNAEDNIKATALFIQDLIKRTGGNLNDVIGSYNRGVRGHSLSPNSGYIDTFLKYYNE